MQPFIRRLCLLTLGSVLISSGSGLFAKEEADRFLQGLKSRGYGRVAVEYLQDLKTKGQLPDDLKETWDLEMSLCLQIAAAKDAYNKTEAEKWVAEAKQHSEAFLKVHAGHARAGELQRASGDLSYNQGLEQLRLSRAAKDPEQKEKHRVEARRLLEASRPGFIESAQDFLSKYQKLKVDFKPSRTVTSRQKAAAAALDDALGSSLQSQFNVGLVDYNIAQSYDPADKKVETERKAALDKAAKEFNAIYQENRDDPIGLLAHMFHGKCVDEMGDWETALEIYDEIAVIAPDREEIKDVKNKPVGHEGLLAQVEYFRLLVVLKQKGAEAFGAEAEPLVRMVDEKPDTPLRKAWRATDGFQGIKLELCKALLAQMEKAPADKKKDMSKAAGRMLAEIVRVKNEHQVEARALLKGLGKEVGEPTNFNEAVAAGDAMAEDGNWEEALLAYDKALQEYGEKQKKEDLDPVRLKLEQANYNASLKMYTAGQYAEAMIRAGKFARANKDSQFAPAAASLSARCALQLYIAAKEKEPALAKLVQVSDFVTKNWPDKPEADDARIALGQASLVQGKVAEALEGFESVNPRSERRALALYYAGQTHWRLFLGYRKEGADEKAAAERLKAEEQLIESLAAQRKELKKGDDPLPKQVFDTQLLLAEASVENGKFKEAAELTQPLVAKIETEKPEGLDNTHLRVFTAAVRANMGAGDPVKAGETVTLLTTLGKDSEQVNGVLVSFLRMMHEEYKRANADLISKSKILDADVKAATEARFNGVKDLLNKFVESLATRKELSLLALMYIGDTSADVGNTETARGLYTRVVDQSEKDPDFKNDKKKMAALTRIQAQLVDLLRRKGDYKAGLDQVEKLITANPKALEPLMVKGRMLQAWAEKEPAKWPEAVAQWTVVRQRLASGHGPKPPEFYEVIYNAAYCLFEDSKQNQDPVKSQQAEQLLNAGKVSNPKLGGPDMVAKYKQLLDAIAKSQKAKPNAAAKN